jgi:hypothetical protein
MTATGRACTAAAAGARPAEATMRVGQDQRACGADHRPRPRRHPSVRRRLHLVAELARLMASAPGAG